MATRVFEGIKFFQEILKRTMAGRFLWQPVFEGIKLYQEDFQRFQKILSFVAMATRVFEGIKFFQEILKRTMAGRFL